MKIENLAVKARDVDAGDTVLTPDGLLIRPTATGDECYLLFVRLSDGQRFHYIPDATMFLVELTITVRK